MLERTKRLPPAPQAERHPTTSTRHGITLVDDYAWLRADNWREVMRDPGLLDPKIRGYLEAENDYTATALAHTEPLQEALFAEMKGRIKEDDSTVPSADGPFAYYTRYREGGQHPILCRQLRDGGAEQALLDGDVLAAGKAYFQLGGSAHSPDHKLLAWSADDKGSEIDTLRMRDLSTGHDLPDEIPDAEGSIVWSADSTVLYYVRLDTNHRPSRVYRHRLGTPATDDALVYEEQDSRFFVSLGELQSRRFATISVHDHETSESWLLDLANPDAKPRLVAPRETSVQYDVEHHPNWDGEERLVIRTNAGKAEDFKVMLAPLADPARENWRDLIPHRRGIFVLSIIVLSDWLIRLEREDSLPRIVVCHIASGEEHTIAFPEEAYSLGADGGYEFVTDRLRFFYSSMTTPNEVWDYDLKTRARTLLKRQEVPSGHDPAAYVTRRIQARAPDGELVPISILHRRDVKPDGTAPLLLYGYGSYGYAIPASFATGRLSLVDRGFVYAIAHIRGGTDKGWHWYQDGKLRKKPNTFTDFIAAAEHLHQIGYAAQGKIIAQGGSAGGLLDGRHRQHAARSVRRHHRRRAVRRRRKHHARRHAAADAAGMAGVGQSDHRRAGIPHHARLFTVRQRAGAGLSGAACARGTDRSARDLLGAGEVGCEAARARHGKQSAGIPHQHGGRSRRRGGTFRPAQGGRVVVCFRDRCRGSTDCLTNFIDCRADIFAGRRYW